MVGGEGLAAVASRVALLPAVEACAAAAAAVTMAVSAEASAEVMPLGSKLHVHPAMDAPIVTRVAVLEADAGRSRQRGRGRRRRTRWSR